MLIVLQRKKWRTHNDSDAQNPLLFIQEFLRLVHKLVTLLTSCLYFRSLVLPVLCLGKRSCWQETCLTSIWCQIWMRLLVSAIPDNRFHHQTRNPFSSLSKLNHKTYLQRRQYTSNTREVTLCRFNSHVWLGYWCWENYHWIWVSLRVCWGEYWFPKEVFKAGSGLMSLTFIFQALLDMASDLMLCSVAVGFGLLVLNIMEDVNQSPFKVLGF